MAEETPEYKKGPASVTEPQLPQGEASQLNEAADNAKKMASASGLAGAGQPEPEGAYVPQPVEYAAPPRVTQEAPGGESDNMLYGPTDRPQEAITTGAVPAGVQTHPKDMGEWLPALQEAAADPGAPEQLKNMLKLILHHTGQ